mmetsp:Transcript_33595/g.81242  ORF Transcript_33595/g.81242 Transcript_33595/m.81242 type:complete len:237 (+) Transcript_33595:459-1169(+)
MPVLVVRVLGRLRGVDVGEERHLRLEARSFKELPRFLVHAVADGVVRGDLLVCECQILKIHELLQQNKLVLVGNGPLVEVHHARGASTSAPSLSDKPLQHISHNCHIMGLRQVINHVPRARVWGHAGVCLNVLLPAHAGHTLGRRLVAVLCMRHPESRWRLLGKKGQHLLSGKNLLHRLLPFFQRSNRDTSSQSTTSGQNLARPARVIGRLRLSLGFLLSLVGLDLRVFLRLRHGS